MLENELRSVNNFSSVSARAMKGPPGGLHVFKRNTGSIFSDGGTFDRSPISYDEIPQ